MGKQLDKLGKIEDYQAPWETATGSDQEIDSGKLKKFLFNLLTDKAKAEDASEEAAEKVTEIQKELETAKAEVAKGDPSGKIAELETALAKAQGEASEAKVAALRVEVGAEKGLTPKQAKRLQGSTKEELEADAAEILEAFGVTQTTTDENDEDEDEDEADEASTEPKSTVRLVNPADKSGNQGEVNYADVVAGFDRRVI